MATNPYQSPQAESTPVEQSLSLRSEARRSLRSATVLLTAAGLLNLYVFGCYYHAFRTVTRLDAVMMMSQVVGTLLIAAACWFLLLPLLEWIGRLGQKYLAPHSELTQWHEKLYISVKPAARLAVAGAILWVIWVIGFYDFKINFYVISYAVGIPAHILAAYVYVPLLYRWFKLCRRPQADSEVA